MTEHDIKALMDVDGIKKMIPSVKQEFLEKEARYLKIKDNDFLALIFMTPKIAISLADEKISLAEEFQLNRIARRLSEGKYFMKKDPVVEAMQFLIKNFKYWEQKFYSFIHSICKEYFHSHPAIYEELILADNNTANLQEALHSTPYMPIKIVSSLFFSDPEEAMTKKKVSDKEYQVIKRIYDQIQMQDMPVFWRTLQCFVVVD